MLWYKRNILKRVRTRGEKARSGACPLNIRGVVKQTELQPPSLTADRGVRRVTAGGAGSKYDYIRINQLFQHKKENVYVLCVRG